MNAEIQSRVEVAVAASGVQARSWACRREDGDFAMLEREITESVAVVLVGKSAALGGRVPLPDTETDPEAYRLFLMGNALLNRRTVETAIQAVASYEEAVRRDPRFAAAWARLGEARIIQYTWAPWKVDVPRESLPELARRAVTTALEL